MFAKKAEFLTNHPKDSYNLVENENGIIERIEILDTHAFWSTSKYLLIQVD
jgi:hypothetical protein